MKIAIVGDLGSWYSEDTRASLQKLADQDKYDWMWHLGDVGYADDDWLHQPFKDGYEEAYNVYMNSIQDRSEEHTSELQSLMRISYAVFCLKKKKTHLYCTLKQ